MLRIVTQSTSQSTPSLQSQSFSAEALDEHQGLLESYFQSHRIRNHSENTIKKERAFLTGFFAEHGPASRPLYTWEAMTPRLGRERMCSYGQSLIRAELSSDTVRAYLGILRNYFAYVLEHPFVKTESGFKRLQDLYGPIDQPISEYDMPVHIYDGERKGVPFDPSLLYDFYAVLRREYLNQKGKSLVTTARNYTALVLAGESGLRINEILHLEVSDLHFDSHKIQTRFAKGTNGSGKRSRLTLFTPIAEDSVRFYLSRFRPLIKGANQTTFLFPSKSGGILDYASLQKGLNEMIDIANGANFSVLNHMSWHWMRRIFATRFIERHPNKLSVLITLLGHMNANTVHKYIRHSEAWMDEQIKETLEGNKKWPSIGP